MWSLTCLPCELTIVAGCLSSFLFDSKHGREGGSSDPVCRVNVLQNANKERNKAGNQIQLELNLNLIPPLWLPTVGHVLKEFNLKLILWLCCVLVPDPSFFFYVG